MIDILPKLEYEGRSYRVYRFNISIVLGGVLVGLPSMDCKLYHSKKRGYSHQQMFIDAKREQIHQLVENRYLKPFKNRQNEQDKSN